MTNWTKVYEEMLTESSEQRFDMWLETMAEDIVTEDEEILELEEDFIEYMFEDCDEIEIVDEEEEIVDEELTEAEKKKKKKKMSVTQRRKIGRILHRGANTKKAQRVKKRISRRRLKKDELEKRAHNWARLQLKKKLLKKLPTDSTAAQKGRIEDRLDKQQFQNRIDRMAKKRVRFLRKNQSRG